MGPRIPERDGGALSTVLTGSDMAHELHSSEPYTSGLGNLPFMLSPFVGRRDELAGVADRLRGHRLVTLTGPAGIGKTRLAVETATALGTDELGTPRLVDLATVKDGTGILDAVALVFSVRQSRHRPLGEALVARLATERVLLILDNCEHLVEPCASTAAFLLQSCPSLRILATSREALGIHGEVVCRVPPLSVPPPGEEDDVEALAARDAVRLFVARAGAQGFSLEPEVAPAVAEICRRLDGIPLAIELGAARVGFLTPDQIAARLADRFHLLTSGQRGSAVRHRTLLAALEWSHDLLSEAERLVLRRLSVFVGGWSLEAAEQVTAAGGGVERQDVLDVLGRLVAQSLVVSEVTGPAARYGFLETIREFALGKLAGSAEEPAVRAAHASWCTTLAEAAESALTGPDEAPWLERLDDDHANLQAALEWSLDRDGCGHALRLAGALVLFWLVRGRLSEGRAWLEACLTRCDDVDAHLRIKALWGAATMAGMLGDFDRARAAADDCLTLSRRSRDLQGVARSLNVLGFVNVFRDLPGARRVLEESAEAAARAGDSWCLANSLGLLGFAEVFRGDFQAAGPYFERCLATALASGDQLGLRVALLGTGYVALERGSYERAQLVLTEGLHVSRRLGDPFYTSVALAYLGELARLRGDHPGARRWSEEALTLARETASPLLLGFTLSFAGRAALDAGALIDARARFEEALALPRVAGNPGNTAIALVGLAQVWLALTDRAQAQRFLDEGLAQARRSGDRLMIATSLLCAARFARSQGDCADSASLAHASLDMSIEIGHPHGIAAALEVVAGLAAEEGRSEYAARLFAAAKTLRDGTGCVRSPSEQPTFDSDLAFLAKSLVPSAMEAAWNQGLGLSPEEACAYAHRSRGPRRRPSSGWASLTPAEREVVHLVAQGLTNAEIGERLFVSRRTVQTHLSHVFAKLGLHSRREVGRALRPGTAS